VILNRYFLAERRIQLDQRARYQLGDFRPLDIGGRNMPIPLAQATAVGID
jgi:hypothetical protein